MDMSLPFDNDVHIYNIEYEWILESCHFKSNFFHCNFPSSLFVVFLSRPDSNRIVCVCVCVRRTLACVSIWTHLFFFFLYFFCYLILLFTVHLILCHESLAEWIKLSNSEKIDKKQKKNRTKRRAKSKMEQSEKLWMVNVECVVCIYYLLFTIVALFSLISLFLAVVIQYFQYSARLAPLHTCTYCVFMGGGGKCVFLCTFFFFSGISH